MPAVGSMYTDRFNPDGSLIPDPVIKSAQLRNRYDQWSRLSTPAQQVLNKLGPTDAFDSMAKNFTATEDGLRAKGLDPYRDERSAQMSMAQVDASPSATAMRQLAPVNQGAAAGLSNLHKRFDSAQAKQEALSGYESMAKRGAAEAAAKQKREDDLAQRKFDNELSLKQLETNAKLQEAELLNNLRSRDKVDELQRKLDAATGATKEQGEHRRRLDRVGGNISSEWKRLRGGLAYATSHDKYVTPEDYMKAQGYEGAPLDAIGFQSWMLTNPEAAARMGLTPHELQAFRDERSYRPPQDAGGGLFDVGNLPQAFGPAGAMLGALFQPQQPPGPWDGSTTPDSMPPPIDHQDMEMVRQANPAAMSPEEFSSTIQQLQARNAPPSVIYELYKARKAHEGAQYSDIPPTPPAMTQSPRPGSRSMY